MYSRFGVGLLALQLLAIPGVGRAQDHKALDLQSLPNPMEALRGIQNAGKAIFMMADANHDGQVSQQESISANQLLVGGFFFRADADGNGSVTEQEIKTVSDQYLDQNPWLKYVVQSLEAQAKQTTPRNGTQPPTIGGVFSLVDANGDKQIQASELRTLVQTMTQNFFAAADTNRDGQMSPSEVNAAVAGAAHAIAKASFQQADTDNNGQLSRAEYDKSIVEPANVVFQILDGNHDGQLSEEESRQASRVIASQIRLFHLPEPANSPTNLIESGRLPREAAPVPNFATPSGASPNRTQPSNPR